MQALLANEVGKVNSMTQGTYRSPIRPPPDDILGIILLLTENSGIILV